MDMGEAGPYQMYGLSTDEPPLGGMFNKPKEMPAPGWVLYISVDSVDAKVEQIKTLGGQVINGPMDVPGGDRIVQCIDPRGATIALHSKKTACVSGYGRPNATKRGRSSTVPARATTMNCFPSCM